jgi:Flp pilus assembly protein TadD
MPSANELFADAFDHHQSGRLQPAEQRYRQVLALDPQHAKAWNLLGVLQTRNLQNP